MMEGNGENKAAPSPTEDRTHLQVELVGPADVEADEFAALTELLREELLLLDVDDVEEVQRGSAPAGAKGIELLAIGTLIVRMARSTRLLDAVVKTVGLWVERLGSRQVRIELNGDVLEVTGLSSAEQRMLIEGWVRRQGLGEA